MEEIAVNLISNNVMTWAMLAVITYLVKTLLHVNQSLIAIEVRINEHERRLGVLDTDKK